MCIRDRTEGEDYRYSEEERSYYALNIAVTADNYNAFTDSTKVYDKVAKQLDESKSPSKKVWLNIDVYKRQLIRQQKY